MWPFQTFVFYRITIPLTTKQKHNIFPTNITKYTIRKKNTSQTNSPLPQQTRQLFNARAHAHTSQLATILLPKRNTPSENTHIHIVALALTRAHSTLEKLGGPFARGGKTRRESPRETSLGLGKIDATRAAASSTQWKFTRVYNWSKRSASERAASFGAKASRACD